MGNVTLSGKVQRKFTFEEINENFHRRAAETQRKF